MRRMRLRFMTATSGSAAMHPMTTVSPSSGLVIGCHSTRFLRRATMGARRSLAA